MACYDSFGWYTTCEISDRHTTIEPPAHDASPVVGQPWPNWTGATWEMLNYVVPQTQSTVVPITRLSKLDFTLRFTDAEFSGLLTLAKTDVDVEAWMKKFDMVSTAADGTSIDLIDARTIAGVEAMCAKLATANVIVAPDTAASRSAAILATS